jgi:hypothetical protein
VLLMHKLCVHHLVFHSRERFGVDGLTCKDESDVNCHIARIVRWAEGGRHEEGI